MEGYRQDELGLPPPICVSLAASSSPTEAERNREREKENVPSITGSINIVTITQQTERERANYGASPLESQGYIVTRTNDGRKDEWNGRIDARSSILRGSRTATGLCEAQYEPIIRFDLSIHFA